MAESKQTEVARSAEGHFPRANEGVEIVSRTDKEGLSLPKSSGQKTIFATGAHRDKREGKGRFDLVPFEGVRRVALRYEGGAILYGDRNWEIGIPLSEMLSSAIRHLMQAADGQTDEDHLAAAGWNVLGAMHYQREIALGRLPKDLDDLPKRGDK